MSGGECPYSGTSKCGLGGKVERLINALENHKGQQRIETGHLEEKVDGHHLTLYGPDGRGGVVATVTRIGVKMNAVVALGSVAVAGVIAILIKLFVGG